MSKYYDMSDLLSYNKILNFIIGQRGGGKTFGAKRWCINDFLKREKEFIWVRRFQTEIKPLKRNFWDDIIASGLYPEVEFAIKGDRLFINNKCCGYLVPLSGYQKVKSSSSFFPRLCRSLKSTFISCSAVKRDSAS